MLRHGTTVFAGIVLLWLQLIAVLHSGSQTLDRRGTVIGERGGRTEEQESVEHAINTICKERKRDLHGSIPIDEMAAQRALPLNDPRVIAGRERAQRLLPMAQSLTPLALSRLAGDNSLQAMNLNWIMMRVRGVRLIKAEVENLDNASVRQGDPHSIIFGTIFLAGLRSDEAMITVMAHELTHVIDGPDQALQPLFLRIQARASQLRPINIEIASELTCDIVALQVAQAYIAQISSGEETKRRLARALEKDCVDKEVADETHLSPRETMRLLLELRPDITRALAETAKRRRPKRD